MKKPFRLVLAGLLASGFAGCSAKTPALTQEQVIEVAFDAAHANKDTAADLSGKKSGDEYNIRFTANGLKHNITIDDHGMVLDHTVQKTPEALAQEKAEKERLEQDKSFKIYRQDSLQAEEEQEKKKSEEEQAKIDAESFSDEQKQSFNDAVAEAMGVEPGDLKDISYLKQGDDKVKVSFESDSIRYTAIVNVADAVVEDLGLE